MSDAGLPLPAWLTGLPAVCAPVQDADVRAALAADAHGVTELAAMLSPVAQPYLEAMAARARNLTRHQFGRTVTLYAPLYLSSYCSSGCVYCGFNATRKIPRARLEPEEVDAELAALAGLGFDEVLLLTGERTPQADFEYLHDCVRRAARRFHAVTVEAFPMQTDEYAALVAAGCTGVTLYQETYDPARYAALHPFGPKRDFAARLDAPARALQAGIRNIGLGVLLGLSDPIGDACALFAHARELETRYWRTGISISFPRIRPQAGGYQPDYPVEDRLLAQMVWAFRLCLPRVHLVLSTREAAAFRDGMMGVGISKMSVASRTTVGGYVGASHGDSEQFHIADERDVPTFCAALRSRGLEPVFKNWDMAYGGPAGG